MKLLDKIKDLFMDEVDVDDELEIEEEEEIKEAPKKKKEENVLPKVMRDTIKREEKVELRVKPEEFAMELERESLNKNVEKPPVETKKFNFPIEFDLDTSTSKSRDDGFNEFKRSDLIDKVNKDNKDVLIKNSGHNINVLDLEKEPPRKVTELYSNKEKAIEKPRFKATPVISPVYGILDKNYTKEEVKERDEEAALKRPSKKVDFETVRKKAFGNLADEIKDNLMCEDCELYKQVKRISSLNEDDLLYDMTVEPETEKDVTIEKAYDNYEAFGVAYEPKVERKLTYEEQVTFEKKEEESKEEKKDEIRLDDIINNSQKIDVAAINDHDEEEDVQVLSKPDVLYEDKIDEETEKAEIKEGVPSRSSKKEAKVDDDFFELIDSMYKERTDD